MLFGRYLPYGFNGVLGGAATLFFAYIGFDTVASTAEEVCMMLNLCLQIEIMLQRTHRIICNPALGNLPQMCLSCQPNQFKLCCPRFVDSNVHCIFKAL